MKTMFPVLACLTLAAACTADPGLSPTDPVLARSAPHGRRVPADSTKPKPPAADTAVPPTVAPVPSTSRAFYVATSGSSAGDGSAARPWSLAAALAQPAAVRPGDTVWVRGGTYRGDVVSNLNGTADKPIIVRQAAGERATVDGKFTIQGRYTWYWGLEVTYSDTRRVTSIAGSDPADLPRQDKTVFVTGPFNKIINFVVHDMGDGLFSGMSAEGVEIYGSVFYNNGWIGPDVANGHNLYLQNSGTTKLVADNAVFNSFAYGLQLYGSENATIYNLRLEGNSVFNSGAAAASRYGPRADLLIRGGAGRWGRSVVTGNNFFQARGTAGTIEIGAAGNQPGSDIEFSNNTVQGQSLFHEAYRYKVTGNRFTSGTTPLTDGAVLVGLRLPGDVGFSDHVWNSNTYAAAAGGAQEAFYTLIPSADTRLFASWKSVTGYDGASTFTTGTLPASAARDVVVRPNRYEPGRAMVTVWNPRDAGAVSVNLTGVLNPGDRYQVHHVYDMFGAPIATGTFGGGSVSIPLPTLSAPAPVGLPASGAPASRAFSVLVVRRI